MKLFTKNNSKSRLFSKDGTSNLFNKLSEYARKGDNTVARVGNFLSSSARTLGFHPVGNIIDSGVKSVHDFRNNLEKSIKAPISEVRPKYN
jgi:hypothetical protein